MISISLLGQLVPSSVMFSAMISNVAAGTALNQARGINKSMRIAQKYNTKQARVHGVGRWDRWYQQWQCFFLTSLGSMILTYFDCPISHLLALLWHRLCLRLPTTRSACHDCWRERQNHHLIRAVRATQSIFLGEMAKRRWLVNDFGFQLWDLDCIYIYYILYILNY